MSKLTPLPASRQKKAALRAAIDRKRKANAAEAMKLDVASEVAALLPLIEEAEQAGLPRKEIARILKINPQTLGRKMREVKEDPAKYAEFEKLLDVDDEDAEEEEEDSAP